MTLLGSWLVYASLSQCIWPYVNAAVGTPAFIFHLSHTVSHSMLSTFDYAAMRDSTLLLHLQRLIRHTWSIAGRHLHYGLAFECKDVTCVCHSYFFNIFQDIPLVYHSTPHTLRPSNRTSSKHTNFHQTIPKQINLLPNFGPLILV